MENGMWNMIAVVTSVAIICGSALLYSGMTLRHRRKLAQQQQGDLVQLQESVEALRDDVQGRLAELNERLDFTERLLTRGSRPPLPEAEHPTPV